MNRFSALAAVACLALLVVAGTARAESLGCGLPDAKPVWIEFSDGSVDFRQAVFGRPGVVVATNGVERAAELRSLGAQTVYWHMSLKGLVGTPTAPNPHELVEEKARALLEKAKAATTCDSPLIALNELWGPARGTPWPESVLRYRNNVVVVLRVLSEGGGKPALLVPGPAGGSKAPFVEGEATEWWRQVATYAHIVKQLYFNAPYISRRGPIVGSRLRRTAMREGIARFTDIGIPVDRLGIMVGFQSGPGSGGREGLQPSSEWFNIIKREALAAKQVAAELGVPTVWSWGWGTFVHFAPQGADADKAAAACVYLWARDQSLCDGPTAAGPGFDPSLTDGQIILPAGAHCSIGEDVIPADVVSEIESATGDRILALRAALQRMLLTGAAPNIGDADARAAERAAVDASFGGDQTGYLAALTERGLSRQAAKNALADILRLQAAGALLAIEQPSLPIASWLARSQKESIRGAICVRDEVPKAGAFEWAAVIPFLVLPEPSVSVDADARVVKRGKPVTLSGTVVSVRPNELVTVYARGPNSSEQVVVGDTPVGPDGAWSLTVRPKGPGVTTYRALSKSAASGEVAVRVKAGKTKKP